MLRIKKQIVQWIHHHFEIEVGKTNRMAPNIACLVTIELMHPTQEEPIFKNYALMRIFHIHQIQQLVMSQKLPDHDEF